MSKVRSLEPEVLGEGVTHQVLGVERDLVPPRRHKLIVTVEDAAVHVLVPPRIEEGFESTEPENSTSRLLPAHRYSPGAVVPLGDQGVP